VRALRFRAHNSAWRGLRFRFDGTTGPAYVAFALRYLALIPTLGFAYAWVKTRQREFVVGQHRFGGERFALSLEWTDLFKVYFVAGIIATVLTKLFDLGTLVAGIDADTITPDDPRFWPWFWLSIVLTLVALGAAYTYIAVRLFNLTWNAVRFGRHRFQATQSFVEMLALRFGNGLAILVTLGFAIPWAKIRMARYRAAHLVCLADGSLEDFSADQQGGSSATGEELGEAFDVDLGL
jgi:uncharacterized membrane protein YjgN (DUF898 family)